MVDHLNINSSTPNEYLTKDLGEASAILSTGIKLLRLERDSQRFYWFVFPSNSQEIANAYWAEELTVIAKHYRESMKALQARINAQRGSY